MDYYVNDVVYATTDADTRQDYLLPNNNRKFGPTLSLDIFTDNKVFAYCASTNLFQHEYGDKNQPLKIAFLSPLALPFCRHCGKVFRNPETFQQHLGDTGEHPYCARLDKPRNERCLRLRDPGPDKDSVLRITR